MTLSARQRHLTSQGRLSWLLILQSVRLRSGISAEVLGEEAGLPPGEVARIDTGRWSPIPDGRPHQQVLNVGLAEIAVAVHALDAADVRRQYESAFASGN